LDVRQLLMPGNISILLLRDLDQQMRAVLVSLIIKRVIQLRGFSEQQERMIPIHLARAEKFESTNPVSAERERQLAEDCAAEARGGIPRSWIIIDEAHNYIPAHGVVPSRKPLKKYVDEGRNLGLSIVVATQQPSGLDPSIQRNADMLLIHALSHHDDIVAAEGMINSAEPSEVVVDSRQKIEGTRAFETLVRNLPLGYALASTDRANRLFPICIRPRVTVHGGTDY
jgi:DNA helicase HerA-like ATPase